MIYAVLAEAVGILGLIGLIFGVEKSNSQERADRATAYEKTLQTMADRIQRPDHIPVAPRPDFLAPEREPDEWNKVGQVVIDPGYGLDETD